VTGFSLGIDVGSLTAEAVALRDRVVIASARIDVLPDPVDSARRVLEALAPRLRERGLDPRRPEVAVATGYGRERLCEAGLADRHVSEISCHGAGAFHAPAVAASAAVRTVIDIGGQDAKVIRVDGAGGLVDFAMNDKCAAGTGHFLELMCRTLGVGLDDLGPLALGARRPATMRSRCTIFVESEVLHLLQRGWDRRDIAAGVCQALADRVVALVRRVRFEPVGAMTGGVAKNVAVRREVEKRLGHRVAELGLDPQLVGAYGAAVLASRPDTASGGPR
jgi:predicted CoA-substrate-specific enzyme activase